MTGAALTLFEIACVIVVVLTLATMFRRRPAQSVLVDYAALAIAGFIGEETCIALRPLRIFPFFALTPRNFTRSAERDASCLPARPHPAISWGAK